DVDGALVEARVSLLEARLFSGAMNGAELPPGADPEIYGERYARVVSGAQLGVGPWRGARAGAAVSRFTDDGIEQREFGSIFAEMDPLAAAGVHAAALP